MKMLCASEINFFKKKIIASVISLFVVCTWLHYSSDLLCLGLVLHQKAPLQLRQALGDAGIL